MTRMALAVVALAFVVAPAAAQHMDEHHGRAFISDVEAMWSGNTNYIMQVAEETDEADYGYRPTEDVRSIGEMIGHIAGAQYTICAAALGDPPRAEDAVEDAAQTKEALIAALQASTEYCATAYAQADMDLQAETQLFGMTMPRFRALVLNATHNSGHYGNLVTYLRMRGTVPPSSRRGME